MLWLLLACTGEEKLDLDLEEKSTGLAEEREIHLLYSNALIGEIEPCG